MALRIALVSTYHANNYHGGNEVYTHNLATALIAQGCHLTYFTSSPVSCTSYPIKVFPLISALNKPIYSTSLIPQILNFKPDIYHFTGSGLPIVTAAFVLKNFYKIPTIHTFQGPLNPTDFISKFGATVEQKLISISCNRIITTTPTIERYVKTNFKHIPTQFIPMSLKPQFFKPHSDLHLARKKLNLPPNKKLILFIGRLDTHHYYKGVGDLITAINQLPKNFILVVVGDGNTKINYQLLSKKLGISNRIIFTGDVSEDSLIDYYSACDIFVLPSTSNSEGFGLVLIEAMSVGKPVISTTAIGSYSWFKDQEVVNFVAPHKPDQLAKMIQKISNNPDSEIIRKALAFAKTFTADQLAIQTIKMYKSSLK